MAIVRRALQSICKQLAKKLGCMIDHEKDIGVYWVYGPVEVYYPIDAADEETLRSDPFEGEHNCYNWNEVFEHLEGYQRDLYFHDHGIPELATETILEACRFDLGAALLGTWWREDDKLSGAALADWLTDQGREPLADVVRAALTVVVKRDRRDVPAGQ